MDDILKKVEQQESTVSQLVKIIAATNQRVSELQLKQENMERTLLIK